MELRDYLRMLGRGWPTVLMVTIISIGLGVGYLAVAPKKYQANAIVFLSAQNSRSVTDLQQGSQFATTAATTYADIIDSAAVLGPVSEQIRPSRSAEQLEEMVTAEARESTSLIDITVTAGKPSDAANIANAAATTASELLPKLTPAVAGSSRSLVSLRVVREALTPTSALSPIPSRVLAIAAIVGIALGLGLTIANQSLDTRLRRPEDVRAVTKVPLLAVLPRRRRSQRFGVVVRDDPASPAVETYRTLRTNLSYLESDSRRSLLFTGVAAGREGVQVPVNLAWSLAQAGRRVLLIDLDLRQSLVGEILHLRGEVGTADVLVGRAQLPDVIHETTQPGLNVVVSGTTQPSPSDLLSNPVMETVLRRAEQEYDYVILHAPPLLTYTDAAVVSRVVGQTLVTVSAGHTRAHELSTALGALRTVRVEPLGVVLAGSRNSVGDIGKARGIWSRTRTSSKASVRRVDWELPTEARSPVGRAG